MDMIFTGTFWGLFLILLGVSVLLKSFFNIDIPVFRILFGVVVIWLGLSIILGRPPISFKKSDQLIFSQGILSATEERREYNVIFSQGKIDLTTLKPGPDSKPIEVNAIFSDATVYISPDANVKISASAAFSMAQLPDGGVINFGRRRFEQQAKKKGASTIELEVNVVFGALRVEYRSPEGV